MNEAIIPFLELKEAIQNSTTQFRQNNDTSDSLFHPTLGFVYGYDTEIVNTALNAFEHTLPSEYEATSDILTTSQKLLMEAQSMSEKHEDMEVRDFARTVAAYMLMNVPISRRVRPNLLKRLKQIEDIRPEIDCLS